MADIAIFVAEKVIKVIGSEAVKEICRMWGYRGELEELNDTITTIKNVLLDADSMHELTKVQEGYIAELKDAVYDADDLFDEVRTLAQLNLIDANKGGMFLGKVRGFFSSQKNKLSQARRMSRRVMEIKGHLEKIASNYTTFGLNANTITSSSRDGVTVNYQAIVRRREDSCSYVHAKDIIGRDKDKDAILDMLLAPNCDDDDEGFRFLTIVGVGGLGKTALAQLVFNDAKIETEFLSFRFWICVSDVFDVRTILSKILEKIHENSLDSSSSNKCVQDRFREQVSGKKYLLVLDDVWNEDHENWVNLKKILMMGAKGSRILITSRSETAGRIIGNKNIYKLDDLSKEDSESLFEMASFEDGDKDPRKVKIGKNIVRKCCGIPLAIKVVGSLLYDKDLNKWQTIEKSIEQSGLTDIGKDNSDKILPILKLSYFNLAPSLKSCFSYCALYPKDSEIDKEMLCDLWIAQGYIIPLDGGQSANDAFEEHFLILMRRCFFQDIKKDGYGNVVSVKIHDLMHDVAQEVKKEEICIISSKTRNLGKKIRHVNIIKNDIENISCRKIRTYVCSNAKQYGVDRQIKNLRALRVLNLSFLDLKRFPRTIDRLLLLRYLNLKKNSSLKVLPNSVTKLYNLQILILRDCENLKEVPKDFSALINLRHLDLYGCIEIKHMPLGILKLNNLQVLPYYLASNEISIGELDVLKQVFNNLKGQIQIERIGYTGRRDSENMKPLVKLTMNNNNWPMNKGKWVMNEDLLEKLKVPPHLNELIFSEYNGKTIPLVLHGTSLQPYLLHIKIKYCENMEQIPALSKLPHLKSLELWWLDSVEYMENEMSRSNNDDTNVVAEFFPSLESLQIKGMNKLKGWWKGEFPEMGLRFSRLTHLEIYKCPNLTTNLVCPPILEQLKIEGISERLVLTGEMGKLRDISIDKIDYLKLIPTTNKCFTSLKLRGEIDVESALEEGVGCFAFSLLHLIFDDCKKMRRLPRLDHLIALEKLELFRNEELRICEEEEDDDEEESLKSFPQSLRQLEFSCLPKMKRMPKGMQHLTSLQSLSLQFLHNMEGGLPEWMSCLCSLQSLIIEYCKGIKSLPEAIKDLTSLKKLHIRSCPKLKERCKEPNGEDFPKIKHIPEVYINYNRISFSQ